MHSSLEKALRTTDLAVVIPEDVGEVEGVVADQAGEVERGAPVNVALRTPHNLCQRVCTRYNYSI
jgi:hypothetical protein